MQVVLPVMYDINAETSTESCLRVIKPHSQEVTANMQSGKSQNLNQKLLLNDSFKNKGLDVPSNKLRYRYYRFKKRKMEVG